MLLADIFFIQGMSVKTEKFSHSCCKRDLKLKMLRVIAKFDDIILRSLRSDDHQNAMN